MSEDTSQEGEAPGMDELEEDVESVAAAVEDWKQAKYFIRRLRAKLFDGDVDYQTFKEEFVQGDELDRELIELVRRIAAEN